MPDDYAYEIQVETQLPPHLAATFDPLRVAHTADGRSVLRGRLPDQSALYGVLARIRDLGLPLVALRRIGPLLLALGCAVPALPVARPAAAEGSDFQPIDAYVQSELEDAHIPGAALAIVHGDRVVHLHGFGTADDHARVVTPQTPFVIGSISKSFTALAVMQLVEHGRVELDTPVQGYLPWFRVADPTASARITVRHLLTQTSGLPTAAGTDPLKGPVTSLEEQVRTIRAVALTAEPGATYTYSNLNSEVLGLIVQTVADERFERYLEQHVFAPLAMRHTFTDSAAAEQDGWSLAHQLEFGVPVVRKPFFRPDFVPAGWIISSAEDLAHYAIAQLNGGRYEGATVLSAAGVAQLHQPAVRQSATAPDFYAMGWIVGPVLDPSDQLAPIWHDGSSYDMHAIVLLEPQEPWGVVLLFNGTSFLYEQLLKQDAIADGVAHRLAGLPSRGTFEGLYTAFDVLVVLVTAMQLRALRGLWRPRPSGGGSWRARLADRVGLPRFRLPGWLGTGWAWYAHGLVPLLVLWRTPGALGAPWPDLVRTDVGAWLLVFCNLQLLIGVLRLRQVWWVSRRPRVVRTGQGDGLRRHARGGPALDPRGILVPLVACRGGAPSSHVWRRAMLDDHPTESVTTQRLEEDRQPAALLSGLRRAPRRAFAVLVIGGLLGVLGLLPYALALSPPQLPPGSPPLAWLLALNVLQSLALIAVAAGLGLRLGPRVGLGAPLLEAWIVGEPEAPRRFRAMIMPSAAAGAIASVVVLLLEILVFVPRLPQDISGARAEGTAPWQGLLASFYGGIDEEILLRLGFMTVLVWLGAKLGRSTQPGSGVVWSANLLAALLFGLSHLPATAALVALTPLVVARAIVLNGLAGVVFGWLYWRRGLLAAMVAHFAADLVLHVLSPALLGRG